MAITSKKLSYYVIAGISAAIIIIAFILTSGVPLPTNQSSSGNSNNQAPNGNSNTGANTGTSTTGTSTGGSNQASNTGTLQVSITDAPANLKELIVTLDSLEVSGQGGWTPLNFTQGTDTVTFNLLALQDVSMDLSIAQLPVGNYSKIRLHVQDANAIFNDGTESALNVPSNKIDIIIAFEIQSSTTTQLLIDMQPNSTSISQSLNLKPVLKATVITPPSPSSSTSPSPSPSPSVSPSVSPSPSLSESPSQPLHRKNSSEKPNHFTFF